MGDSVSNNPTTVPLRNPNLSKWDILFDKKVVEWISFKPQLGLNVYPCYACRHMFSSKNSFLDHVNRRALVLQYKCRICSQDLTFYNPCSFLLHTRQHFTLLGGQIYLDNLRISILPFGLGGFLPDPNVPLLYNVDEDEIGEVSIINTRFYSPLQETMGQSIISFIPNEVLFLFMVEPNGSLSSLVLKQISSTIPKCKFITMDNNRLNPIPIGLDIFGRGLQDSTNNNNTNTNVSDESVIEIKQEPEDVDENTSRIQYACPIITKIETVKEKEHDKMIFPKCSECELLIHDRSMPEHFLDTNRPFREHLKCIVCKYIAPTKCSLEAHERIHQNLAPHVCPECGQDFTNGDLLRSHLDDVCFHLTKQVRLKCPGKKCGKVFAQILTFTTHFAVHMRRLKKCPHCDDVFTTDTEYFQHGAVSHNSKSLPTPIYDCSVCKESFNEGASSDHIYDHATNKKQCVYVYICKHCRSYFRSTTTYATHIMRCTKLVSRMRIQNEAFNKVTPLIEKPKKKQSLYILGTCLSCKTQIKAQVPKIDNMPVNCPNCTRPLKSKSENVLFLTGNDTGINCVLCQDVLDPMDWDSHFNVCKYYKPSIPLQHVEVKYSDSEVSPKLETNFKKKRRKPWTTPQSSKQKRLSISFEPEPINLDPVEPTAFDGTYYCKLCSFSGDDRTEFHRHVKHHRNVSTAYQCMECGECFVVKPSLEKHLVFYHQISDTECYFCENDCFDKQAVKELEDVMHLAPGESKDVADNQCRVCLQLFDDPSELSKHFRTHGMAFILKNSK